MPEREIQVDYIKRINRVFQYIDSNLYQDLSLNTLSEIAAFSPFHFHRIFKTLTNETLNEYVTRRRIEKCASELIHRNTLVIDIAFKYGFKDKSTFTRAFKKFYNVSPTEFRKQNSNRVSKISQLESKNSQPPADAEKYICIIDELKKWTEMNAQIEVKEIPQLELAYVSSMGTQNLPAAYQKLMRWATPYGLLNEHTKMVTIYHDSLKVTEENKARVSACIVLTKPIKAEGEVELTTLPEGKYIVGSFEIGIDEFEKSWTGLFMWMNGNGYKKTDGDVFEIYYNDFTTHPEKKARVDFYIPVE